MKKALLALPLLASVLAPVSSVSAHGDYESKFCATDAQKAQAYEFVTKTRPGKPLAVGARALNIIEGTFASGLVGSDLTVGTLGTAEKFREIWASVEKWGAKTKVGIYWSANNKHTFSFPSYVPMSLPDDGSGMQDIYADDGKGIHSHVVRDDVKGIFATRLIIGEHATRTVTFYDSTGDLIWGIIASEANGKGEKAAIDGFEETWKLIASMPQICAPH